MSQSGQKQKFRGEVLRELLSEQDRMPDNASDVLVAVGGPVEELSAGLAVYGEDLDPSEVTSMLGVEPSYSFRRGYRRGAASPPAPHGAWILEVRAVNQPEPGALIGTLLSKLPQDAEIWRQLNDRFKVQLRIAIHMEGWNKGFDIDVRSVSQLANIGAEVVFDIYADDGDDSDDE